MKEVADFKRYFSPTVTPLALAWDGKQFWMSSRNLAIIDAERDILRRENGTLLSRGCNEAT